MCRVTWRSWATTTSSSHPPLPSRSRQSAYRASSSGGRRRICCSQRQPAIPSTCTGESCSSRSSSCERRRSATRGEAPGASRRTERSVVRIISTAFVRRDEGAIGGPSAAHSFVCRDRALSDAADGDQGLGLRALGSTGLEVTPLCVGASALGNTLGPYRHGVALEDALATVRRAVEGPVNFLDTSNNYGDS